MLTSLVKSPATSAEEKARYVDELNETARRMVTSLDEIVWAVNPRNDTIASLASYFGAYAQRLLELASVACGLDVADDLPDYPLDPKFRQELFLAFKEALTNVVRHARANKVWLRMSVQDQRSWSPWPTTAAASTLANGMPVPTGSQHAETTGRVGRTLDIQSKPANGNHRSFPGSVAQNIAMIKVGIVEDNKTLREGFETLINRTPGLQCVCTCTTVAEALKKIPKAQPDVVLMDIQLPDKSGVECTAQVKELLPSVHIIIVTVYEDSDRIFQALRAGACGYLLKRAKPERVIAAIQEAQEGGVPMTPEIARKVIGHFREQAVAASEAGEPLSA